jgi:hypothetical protein
VSAKANARAQIQLATRDVVYESGDLAAAAASVCITLYNYAASVVAALESAYAQTLAGRSPSSWWDGLLA